MNAENTENGGGGEPGKGGNETRMEFPILMLMVALNNNIRCRETHARICADSGYSLNPNRILAYLAYAAQLPRPYGGETSAVSLTK